MNQPPRVSAGPDQTVECTSPTGGTVTLDGSGSSDPDNDILHYQWWQGPAVFGSAGDSTPTSTTLAPFSPPQRTTDFSLSIVDKHLATRMATTYVTVRDTTPPTLNVGATPDCLWAPNHKMVLFQLGQGISATAVDKCDATPSVAITSVTSSQPPTGGGSGATAPDVRFGQKAFCLRSEREGTSPEPRVYTVALRATDASENSSSAQTTIRVGHDQSSPKCPKVDSARVVDDNDPRCTAN